MSGSSLVVTEREGSLVTIILNRPEKLNALNKEMWAAIGQTMTMLDGDDDIRCIIIRGAGEKAMGPGADIAEFAEERYDSISAAEYGGLMHRAMGGIRACRHPVVAQIHGLCVGGALEIAAMCDIRICGESSRFGIPVNRLGLVMAYPEIDALVELVGRSTALEILLEGRVFDAAEAKEKGLVNRVVPDDQVAAEALATSARICAGAPLVNRWHKKFAERLSNGQPLTAAEQAEGFACFDSEDFKIGYQAFLAKETPEFEGR